MRATGALTVAALMAHTMLMTLMTLAGCTAADGAPTDTTDTTTTDATAVEPNAVEPNAVVVEVVDGDTIDVDFEGTVERVRLIGIDTPETRRPNHPVECGGPEASAFTADLLPLGTAVRVERDVVGRDDYGRLLGYVHRASDGLFVNRELVRRGHARPLTIAPNDLYAAAFATDARSAEAADVGMWASCR
jgi:micrococcal nuclease